MGRHGLDPRIEALKSTTFSGRRLSRKQIADIQETVALFPNDSRRELCQTICEHLNWVTAKGDYRVSACLNMLEHLERHDILTLPPKVRSGFRPGSDEPVWSTASDPQPEISASLSERGAIRLDMVTDKAERQLWNAFVDRHHYLGYRRPFGQHIRYFVRDAQDRMLGCLLFDAGTKFLPCRDQWVGWSDRVRNRNRHLLVTNARFLVFPWVSVKNLASHTLELAKRQLADDWQERYSYRPVLCETFVDQEHFTGAAYRAANWQRIGETQGGTSKAPKAVYVLPLVEDSCAILRGERPAETAKKPLTTVQKGRASAKDKRFHGQWERIVNTAVAVAEREDKCWQKRRRVFNSLLIILFVFRLVVSREAQGYKTALSELWEHCRDAGIPLAQEKPPVPSTASEARDKLDERAFKRLHRAILAQVDTRAEPLWKGHRIHAVDGAKITLPRPLVDCGYKRPNDGAHYPQGLVSVLYRLHTRIPVDVELFNHGNERAAALAHLAHAGEGDVIVYDRGYYSFAMLHTHIARGLHCVLRIPGNACPALDEFIASDRTDQVIDLDPPRDDTERRGQSCRVRLVKYVVADTQYCLATTLLDSRKYSIEVLSDLYHGRWSIEERYKSGKTLIIRFHGKTERSVRQELYATFTLIALSRLFANR